MYLLYKRKVLIGQLNVVRICRKYTSTCCICKCPLATFSMALNKKKNLYSEDGLIGLDFFFFFFCRKYKYYLYLLYKGKVLPNTNLIIVLADIPLISLMLTSEIRCLSYLRRTTFPLIYLKILVMFSYNFLSISIVKSIFFCDIFHNLEILFPYQDKLNTYLWVGKNICRYRTNAKHCWERW